jgi:tricarballylate dehydrogenase
VTGTQEYGVIVVGGGLAGIAAAIAGANEGARVLLLEKAPRPERGGNSSYGGGGFKYWRSERALEELIPELPEDQKRTYYVEPFTEDDYLTEVMRMTRDLADPALAKVMVHESWPLLMWLKEQGVTFEVTEEFTRKLPDGRLMFPKDRRIVTASVPEGGRGGRGLADTLYESAERKGVEILYETKAFRLQLDPSGNVCGVEAKGPAGVREIFAKAVVLATGGFESNREWRTKYLGPGWNLIRPRGSRYSQGDGIRMALDVGAKAAGHWAGCQAAVTDWDVARTPEGQDLKHVPMATRTTRRAQLGIEVNVRGQRYFDEGEDIALNLFCEHANRLVEQPEQIGWQIFDAKTTPVAQEVVPQSREPGKRGEGSRKSMPYVTADSLSELADKLRAPALVQTVAEFNAAAPANGALDRETLESAGLIKDARTTSGVYPPKSNWAYRLDMAPFAAFKVTAAISFTFGGIAINPRGQVVDAEEKVIPGLYATGDVVGGVWYYNYVAGSANTFAAVFGRIAGTNAARD